MARDLHFPTMPMAEEYDVGDDSDLPGFDQPVTMDDLDAVVNSGRATVDEKRGILVRMLDDLQAREGMDESGEYSGLTDRIRDALASLEGPAEGIGTPGAYGFDAGDRVMQPDEILEREEAEAAERRED